MKSELIRAGKLHEELFDKLRKFILPQQTFSAIFDYIYVFFEDKHIEVIENTLPITINVNNIVYHGLPGVGSLESGDIVTIDICFSYRGFKIDGASTFCVDCTESRANKLLVVSRDAVREVVRIVDVGVSVSQIIKFLSDYISSKGFYLLPHGMGHGIGESLHERPFFSLNDFSDFDYVLKKGELFTLEPIVLLQEEEVYENILGEGIIDKNNLSSQFEVTLFIEDRGRVHILNGALIN